LFQFKNQNCLPEYIQIGNEVNQGMLWNFGKLSNFNDTNWNYFKAIQEAAIAKIKTLSPSTKIILHYAGLQGAYGYYTKAQQMQIPFDLLGISYYPWWHGDLTDLKNCIAQLNQFSKPIILAETAYPFTLNWNDWTNNIVGTSNQLLPSLPASALGQSNFIDSLWKIMNPTNQNQTYGICYWAPEYVAYKGAQDTSASPWENLCLFDFQNNACIGIKALGGK
jgi:arabinogalactan endo-1,4-beta-galactosidase